jgi:pimeloyl-ACP methyl ester carboxylesterase
MTVADVELRRIALADVELSVAVAGTGPALVLLHGWPHTWQVWSAVLPELARSHTVIAPDLRGMGASSRPASGYDAATVAGDVRDLLGALGIDRASVAAIDLGVTPALLLALREPRLVDRLVLMEAVLPALPGAESFLAAGPPWWFGFHAVPGLAETVLSGGEAAYLDFFLDAGTSDRSGIDRQVRDAFVSAYSGPAGLRGGFEHYRAAPANGHLLTSLVANGVRLEMPTLALGAQPVGDALFRQLQAVADDLTGVLLPDSGHIVPLDRPDELLRVLLPFLGVAGSSGLPAVAVPVPR